jgi:hypothetical protein
MPECDFACVDSLTFKKPEAVNLRVKNRLGIKCLAVFICACSLRLGNGQKKADADYVDPHRQYAFSQSAGTTVGSSREEPCRYQCESRGTGAPLDPTRKSRSAPWSACSTCST